MNRGSLVFTAILILVTLILLIATMAYPVRSKLFPLMALSTILVLLIVQVTKEAAALKGKEPVKRGKPEIVPYKQLLIWVWLAVTLVMLLVFGFMGTVILLPFLYLRFQREGWLISIFLPIGCCLFFYSLFGLALNMPLYPGMLFPRLFE